jgi:tetrahydromethanopterin S-methyltransferase subunit F
MIGVLLGALSRSASPADPSLTLAALFGTSLAPIAGRFGLGWGLAAGFVHASAALTVGPLHAGLNLYNNGFAAGIVAAVLVPVILALRAGLGYRDVEAPE